MSSSLRLVCSVLFLIVLVGPLHRTWAQVEPSLLDPLNEARAETQTCGDTTYAGQPLLQWDDDLAEAAIAHAEDIATHGIYGHTGSDGSRPHERVQRVTDRFRATGEVIAFFASTPEEAAELWLESSGHCATLMQPHFTHVGGARDRGPRFDQPNRTGTYWVAVFGELSPIAAEVEELSADEIQRLRRMDITIYGHEEGYSTHLREVLDRVQVDYAWRDVRSEDHRQAMWRDVRRTAPDRTEIQLPVVTLDDAVIIGPTSVHDVLEH